MERLRKRPKDLEKEEGKTEKEQSKNKEVKREQSVERGERGTGPCE